MIFTENQEEFKVPFFFLFAVSRVHQLILSAFKVAFFICIFDEIMMLNYNFPILTLDMRQEHDAHRYGGCTFIYRNPPITRLLKHECGCLGCILVQFDMHRRVSFLLPDFGLEPKKGE